jgi:hypothetical protein
MWNYSSQIKLAQYPGFGGSFVDSDYLISSYNAGQPHVFEQMMGKVFSASNRFSQKPLLGMTLAKGKSVTIDNEIYRWSLMGAEEKALRSLGNVEPASNVTLGLGKESFRIKLDEGWLQNPDVIIPENNEYPMEIVDGPFPSGQGYEYIVQLQTDDTSKFLDSAYVDSGKLFYKKSTSTVSELNGLMGTTQFGATFQLQSQIGHFGQELTVTDKALREQGRLGVPYKTKDGSSKEMFIPYAEAKTKDELYKGVEWALLYGKKSTRKGYNGYTKFTGPGLREQLRDGWTQTYNGVLSESLLKDYLLDIFFGRVDEQDRKIVAMTGTLGAMIFHDMLAGLASGFLTVDTHFIEKVSKKDYNLNDSHLAFGAQFVQYRGPVGIDVTLVYNPSYDDVSNCPEMHPIYTDMPVDSARFTFLDFGKTGKVNGGMLTDNIQFLQQKDYISRHGYIPGSVTPMGVLQGGATSSKIAGYTTFCETSGGIVVYDVTRAGELIPDFSSL